MSLKKIILRMAVLGWATAAALTLPAVAQEISESHLAAAKAAINAAGASRGYDDLLPAVSQMIQNQLIRMRPDLHAQITEIVGAEALKLVNRRPELDTDIARIWAAQFSEEELNAITTFYKSPAGQKFFQIGPKVIADSLSAARAWSDRIREELLATSREALKAQGIEF